MTKTSSHLHQHKFFEIESKTNRLKIFMVANHPDGKRAKIYAVNANTGQIEDGIGFIGMETLLRSQT